MRPEAIETAEPYLSAILFAAAVGDGLVSKACYLVRRISSAVSIGSVLRSRSLDNDDDDLVNLGSDTEADVAGVTKIPARRQETSK